MPLKLSVRVGESVEIGGPATVRIDRKSGQVVGMVFEADPSVPIRLVSDGPGTSTPEPRGVPLGIGHSEPGRTLEPTGLTPRK